MSKIREALFQLEDLTREGGSDLPKEARTELDALENELAETRRQLAMTHQQVAETARMLDPVVVPDAWGLHVVAQATLRREHAMRVLAVAGLAAFHGKQCVPAQAGNAPADASKCPDGRCRAWAKALEEA